MDWFWIVNLAYFAATAAVAFTARSRRLRTAATACFLARLTVVSFAPPDRASLDFWLVHLAEVALMAALRIRAIDSLTGVRLGRGVPLLSLGVAVGAGVSAAVFGGTQPVGLSGLRDPLVLAAGLRYGMAVFLLLLVTARIYAALVASKSGRVGFEDILAHGGIKAYSIMPDPSARVEVPIALGSTEWVCGPLLTLSLLFNAIDPAWAFVALHALSPLPWVLCHAMGVGSLPGVRRSPAAGRGWRRGAVSAKEGVKGQA